MACRWNWDAGLSTLRHLLLGTRTRSDLPRIITWSFINQSEMKTSKALNNKSRKNHMYYWSGICIGGINRDSWIKLSSSCVKHSLIYTYLGLRDIYELLTHKLWVYVQYLWQLRYFQSFSQIPKVSSLNIDGVRRLIWQVLRVAVGYPSPWFDSPVSGDFELSWNTRVGYKSKSWNYGPPLDNSIACKAGDLGIAAGNYQHYLQFRAANHAYMCGLCW